jgi:hypothetical protein
MIHYKDSLENEGIVYAGPKGYADGRCHNWPTLGKDLVENPGITIDLPLENILRV